MYSDKVETFHGWKVKEESRERVVLGEIVVRDLSTRDAEIYKYLPEQASNLIRCRRGGNRIYRISFA